MSDFLRPLGDLLAIALRHRSRPRVAFTRVRIGRLILTGDFRMLTVPNDKKTTLSIAPKDAYEQTALVDGSPAWSLTNDSLATLTPSADGLSAVLEPSGPVGTFQVRATADADLGEGVREITGLLEVEIVASEAVALGISAGALEPRVAAAPPVDV